MASPKSRQARGYGTPHQRERERWEPLVATGQVLCHARRCLMKSRVIAPSSPWDLGHTTDRTQWTGPEHARCNRSEGATRGNKGRGKAKARSRWLL